MAHTPYLQVIPQRHAFDCSVACLAMLLGVSYEDALVAFNVKDLIRNGVYIKDMRRAALVLGVKLRVTTKFDVDTDTGILNIEGEEWLASHLVLLKEGLVVDTDATIWEVDVFMAAYKAKPVSLMVVADEGVPG